MDLKEILETIEAYAQNYIRYVLSVADRRNFKRHSDDFDPKLVTFSLISALIGDYIYQKVSGYKDVSQSDTLFFLISEYSIWMFMAILVYFGLNARSDKRVGFQTSISIVLRVLPVAFLVSAYAGEVISEISKLFRDEACAPWWGYPACALCEAALIVLFAPISISKDAETSRARRWAITGLVVVVVVVAQVFSVSQYLRGSAEDLYNLPQNSAALAQAKTYFSAADNQAIQACGPSVQCQKSATIRALTRVDWEGIKACTIG